MVTKDELITKWATKTTYGKPELEKIYAEVLAEERVNYPTEAPAEAEKQALAIMGAKLKKELLGGTVNKRIWVIAADRLSDFTGRRFTAAKDLFAKNPEQAVTGSVTDDTGTPLYPASDKFRAGKPLPEHDYQRTVYGFHPLEGVYNISLKGEAAREFKGLVGKLVELPVWINKNKSKQGLTVGSFNKRSTAIRAVEPTAEDGKPMEVTQLFPAVKSKQEYQTKVGTYEPVLIKGLVVESRETDNPEASNVVTIDAGFPDGEFEDIVTCWVEPNVPIDFADNSEVIVLGTCGERTDDEGKKSLQMNVCGIYATERTIKEKPQEIPKPTAPAKGEDENAW